MYLLDANIFITAKNRHYGFDIVPGFWEWLDRGHRAKILCSVDAVLRELVAGKDDLSSWATARRNLFIPPDPKTRGSFTRLATWANSGVFTPAAVAEFLASADYELVAIAHAHKHIVVTHEHFSADAKKRILIPNACKEMGVDYMDPYKMLRTEGAKFILP
ncbi:DUF4411 family protein [Nocardia cyriacigeorgica]|uniref:DUF4411 family protein n=1 Tax=Nocardia cyriacigeorgica TaxID=135487 RepID=UPI002456E202|nr:DUF4411 family protein [Nocardia cyriacigeorgica]